MAERRSGSKPPGAGRSTGVTGERSSRDPGGERDDQAPGTAPHVCPVAFCPIGMALTMTGQVRPEVVEHLMNAGRELLLAMKAVVDARVEGFERESPIERITIE